MHRGKVSETTLKRSILKNISSVRSDVVCGAELSSDAAVINIEDVTIVMSSNIIENWFDGCINYAVQKTINNIFIKCGIPMWAQLNIVVPHDISEQQLGSTIKEFNKVLNEYSIEIVGGHTMASEAVDKVIASFTIIGNINEEIAKTDFCTGLRKIQPGDEIVMTKSIAVGGTAVISKLFEDKLLERFNPVFVNECKEMQKYISVEKDVKIASVNGAIALHDISTGGAFAGIWELTSQTGLGIKVNMEEIPVWQHTVEVAEVFDLNPYILDGTGSLLIVTKDGKLMVDALAVANIPSNVIGLITDNKDRVIINGDEKRFLEPQRGDEIYKIYDKFVN